MTDLDRFHGGGERREANDVAQHDGDGSETLRLNGSAVLQLACYLPDNDTATQQLYIYGE